MSEETDIGQEQPVEDPTAWREVLERLEDLGEAVGKWTQAAVADPDNKRRAIELKEHLDSILDKMGQA